MPTQRTKYWLALLPRIVSPLTAAPEGTAGKEESELLATTNVKVLAGGQISAGRTQHYKAGGSLG